MRKSEEIYEELQSQRATLEWYKKFDPEAIWQYNHSQAYGDNLPSSWHGVKQLRDIINTIESLQQKIKEQRELEISTCEHAYVINEIIKDNYGMLTVVYYCPICGLINGRPILYKDGEYNQFVNMQSLASKYGKGICISPEIISMEEADSAYEIVSKKVAMGMPLCDKMKVYFSDKFKEETETEDRAKKYIRSLSKEK